MSEQEKSEDLDLDGADADAVVGGRMNMDHAPRSELGKLLSQGFVEQECMKDGSTLLVNHHTGKRCLIPGA